MIAADQTYSCANIRSFRAQNVDFQTEDFNEATSQQKNSNKGEMVALIADDDEFFRMALGMILKKHLGFTTVIEATSFEESLAYLQSRDDISLALYDLAMPGMESAASLRAVRENFPEKKIAIISGSGRRSDVLLALNNGVHGYVPKSLGAPSIRNALAMILNGQVYVPPLVSEIEGEEAGTGESTDQSALKSLTPRQKEILRLLVKAKSNKEIARTLSICEGTVKVHLSALFRNLGTDSRSATAVIGAQLFG